VATYVAPIEKPKGIMPNLGYWYTRRHCGTVPGPLSVFCARMPSASTSFYGKVGKLDKKLTVSSEMTMLIRERVASTNTCRYCMDANRWAAIKQSVRDRRQARRARDLRDQCEVQ
jgi:alkylhydroperoxidase family enzyme